MRIALSSNTSSSAAVLKSLLAFASLHRYGLQSQAFELKISSIKALAAASGSNAGDVEVIQHVATGMLLCSFEVGIHLDATPSYAKANCLIRSTSHLAPRANGRGTSVVLRESSKQHISASLPKMVIWPP